MKKTWKRLINALKILKKTLEKRFASMKGSENIFIRFISSFNDLVIQWYMVDISMIEYSV